MVTLHRRRGGTQNDECPRPLRPHDRDVAAVVARALVLLVRRVMFLVHNHQPDPLEWCEDRRPCAHHDVDVAAPDALPLVVPFAVGKAAVLNRHTVAERLTEERRDGRGERNFWHQHQHRPSAASDAGREPNVEFRLSASGDAVHKRHTELARLGKRREPLEPAQLLGGQMPVGFNSRRVGGLGRERVALDAFLAQADERLLGEPRDGVRPISARCELWSGKTSGRSLQQLEHLTLFRGQGKGDGCRFRHSLKRSRPLFACSASSPAAVIDATRSGLVRIRPCSARLRRQNARQRLAWACSVVLRRPRREIDHVARHERLVVEHLAKRFDGAGGITSKHAGRRVIVHDDTGHDPRAERYDHARADHRARRCRRAHGR